MLQFAHANKFYGYTSVGNQPIREEGKYSSIGPQFKNPSLENL